MSESENFDFSKHKWQAVHNIWTSLLYSFIVLMGIFFEKTDLHPPAGYRVNYDVSSVSRWIVSNQVMMPKVAKRIGIDDETSYLRLRWHWNKIRGYTHTVSSLSFRVGPLTGFAVFALALSGFEVLFGSLPNNPAAEFASIAVGFILIWILLQTS